ncbi:PAX-interacting protein 1-like isoform X1 [Diorhabda carinulata]|uniref:PAX-interacting protein 1-like isoform X1 n=1 Tax=Diorhabda carinulata TaxID=1163345 RepID=UPI0025A2FC10|nr:PAX-interacting protein 1-like isoform X1 [Diorhabda carinulata]
MGDLTSSVAKLEMKENLFEKIKFYISGDVDEKVVELLKNGHAERLNYFSDYVTHLIVGENSEENDIVDATDVYEIPAVTPKWILMCAALQKLVSIKPYLYSPNGKLFSKFTFCFSHIREDRNYLWSLITYHGGQVQLNFDKNCQFLVTTEFKGAKAEKVEEIGPNYVKIVTPDWVVEAVKNGILPDTSLFHPKLINWPKPIEYESTAAITGFEPEQSNIEENAEEKVISDSTQALLDKLKQRMPWNQPKIPSSTPMASITDPIAPPNVVAPSFMQKTQQQQQQMQHQQNTLQKIQTHPTTLTQQQQQPHSTPQSPVNSNFPQIPSSPTTSLNNQVPKSIIHHTPNQQQGFQQLQVSQQTQQQQHPLNISRLIGQSQPRPNLQLRGQLVQSQLQQQLLQQQNQGNVIQRSTSQVPIPQQLLQQQLAQRQLVQRQLLQNQLNQNQLLQQQQQISTSQQQIIQSQQQITTSQHLSQLTQQQLAQLQQQQLQLKQNKQMQLSQSQQQLLNQNLQQLQLNQNQQQLQINQNQQIQLNKNQQQIQLNPNQQQIQLNQNQQQIQLNQNQQQIPLNQNQQQIQLNPNQQQIQLNQSQHQNQQHVQLNQSQQQIQLNQNQQTIQLNQNQQQIQLKQNHQQIQLNQNQQQIQMNQNQQQIQMNQNQQQVQLNQNQQIQLNQNQQQIQLNQNQPHVQLNQNQQQNQVNQNQQQIPMNQNQIQLGQIQQQIQLNSNQQIQMNQNQQQLQLTSNLQQIAANQNQQVQSQQIMQNQVIQPQQQNQIIQQQSPQQIQMGQQQNQIIQQQSPQQIQINQQQNQIIQQQSPQIQISQAQGFVQQNVNIISQQNQQILQQKQFLLNQHQAVTSQQQFVTNSFNQSQDLNQQQNLSIQNLNQQLSTHNLGQQLNQQQLNQQLTQHSPIGQQLGTQSQQNQLVQLNSQEQLEQRLSQQNQLNQINQQQNRLGQQNQMNQTNQIAQQTPISQQNTLSQQQITQQHQLNQQLNQVTQQQIGQGNVLNQSTLDEELGSLNQQLNQGLNNQIQQQQLSRQTLQQQHLGQQQLGQQQQIGPPQQIGQQQMQVQQQATVQQNLQQQINQINQQVAPGLPQVVRTQFQQQPNIGSQILINQSTSQNPGQRPQINQHIWTQQSTQISGQQIIRHPVNVIQQHGGPRLQWSPTAQQGNAVPQRQFIQLDARTHQELQKMPPEQQAIFVAKIQRQRQLLKQVQQRGGSHILIRGNVPPGLTTQQQVQWLQQQAKQQGIVLPPNIQQQNITPGTLTQPSLAQNMQHAPGLSPINQNAGQFTDQNQQQQIQLRQFRLQQLQLQREQAQKNHLAQQQAGTIQQPPVVRPIGQPPIADSTTNLPHVQEGTIQNPLVVNAKTKTALANMLSIKLQSGGSSVGVQRADTIQEPSAAGTLRLMTAQHNAAINSKPQEIIALQRRTINGPNGEIIKPPGAQLLPSTPTTEPPKLQYNCPKPALTPLQHRPGPFYGHNPNLKLPPDLFLLGCVFVVVELEDFLEEKIPGWQEKIAKHGGEVEKQYCSRVTHVLCETQRHGVVMQALRDCKRCVTIIWLSDVMQRKQVLPPWTALHLPNIYLDTTPAAKHLISISGFEGNDRARVKQMINYTGAKCTTYFSKHNTLLISAKADGKKCAYAKKWQIPVVNVQWLTDIMLGHFTALNQLEHQIYQQFPNPPNFSFDPKLVPNLMVAWKAPINISQESYERVKRSASPVVTPKKPKKSKVDSTDENDNISDEMMADCSYKILFSLVNEAVKMKQMIKELGGCIAKDHHDFTHLVMPQLARTNKLFFAIAKEAHVVSEQWLKDSHENNQFLPENKYSLHSKEFNFEYKCDIDQTFQTRNRSKLFDGKFFFVTPSVFPSKRIIVELIQCCGGIVEKHRRSSSQIEITTVNSPYSYFIITHEDDLHLVADLLRNKKDKMKVVCNAELIFSAVLKQTFEVDPYAVSVL